VTLRNLIPQTIGTTDGTTLDPSGIRIFFHEGPTVTSGTGTVTVNNADGSAIFISANQPFFQYNQMLPEFGLSSAKTWKLDMPSTVNTFTFKVYVDAPVRWPTGYVLLQSGNTTLRSDATRLVVPTSKSPVGNDVSGATYTWGSSNATLGSIDATGTIQGLRDGAITITATDDAGRVGTMDFIITPITRFWTGAIGTGFGDGGNWTRGISPTSQDTVQVPSGLGTYPVFVQNHSIAGLTVLDGGSITQQAFDLTVSGDVNLAGINAISATTGRLILSGVARSLTGSLVNPPTLPRVLVLQGASYTMNTTNITLKQKLQVNGGRIRVERVRLRVNNQ
jgi:hypothetical protein